MSARGTPERTGGCKGLHPSRAETVDVDGDVVTLLGIGAALAATCLALFVRRRTTIVPHGRATALVTSGPYRLTRNPMYVSLTCFGVGVAVATNVLWSANPAASTPAARRRGPHPGRGGHAAHDLRRRVSALCRAGTTVALI